MLLLMHKLDYILEKRLQLLALKFSKIINWRTFAYAYIKSDIYEKTGSHISFECRLLPVSGPTLWHTGA